VSPLFVLRARTDFEGSGRHQARILTATTQRNWEIVST
jgi:hypothetical protein